MMRCKGREHTLKLGPERSKLFHLFGTTSCYIEISSLFTKRYYILTLVRQRLFFGRCRVGVVGQEVQNEVTVNLAPNR